MSDIIFDKECILQIISPHKTFYCYFEEDDNKIQKYEVIAFAFVDIVKDIDSSEYSRRELVPMITSNDNGSVETIRDIMESYGIGVYLGIFSSDNDFKDLFGDK